MVRERQYRSNLSSIRFWLEFRESNKKIRFFPTVLFFHLEICLEYWILYRVCNVHFSTRYFFVFSFVLFEIRTEYFIMDLVQIYIFIFWSWYLCWWTIYLRLCMGADIWVPFDLFSIRARVWGIQYSFFSDFYINCYVFFVLKLVWNIEIVFSV